MIWSSSGFDLHSAFLFRHDLEQFYFALLPLERTHGLRAATEVAPRIYCTPVPTCYALEQRVLRARTEARPRIYFYCTRWFLVAFAPSPPPPTISWCVPPSRGAIVSCCLCPPPPPPPVAISPCVTLFCGVAADPILLDPSMFFALCAEQSGILGLKARR